MSTPEPAVSAEAAARRRRRRLTTLAIVVLVLLGAYAAFQLLYGRYHESTDDAYVAADVMPVTSEIAGTVSSVLVDDTQHVEPGQTLVELDRADARIALAAARADLARAVREVRSLHSQADGLRAEIRERALQLAAARADVGRREAAGDGGAVSAEELQHARDKASSSRRRSAQPAARSRACAPGSTARRWRTTRRSRPPRRGCARPRWISPARRSWRRPRARSRAARCRSACVSRRARRSSDWSRSKVPGSMPTSRKCSSPRSGSASR